MILQPVVLVELYVMKEKQRCAIPITILCTTNLRRTSVGLNLCHHVVKLTGNYVGYGNSDVQFIPDAVQNVT